MMNITYTLTNPSGSIMSNGTMPCSSYDDGLTLIHSKAFREEHMSEHLGARSKAMLMPAEVLSTWAVSDGWHVTQYMDTPDGIYSVRYEVDEAR